MSDAAAASAGSPPVIPPLVPGSLEGRVILVTGAAGGLGGESALACARAGASVVLLGHRQPKLAKVYDAIAKVGPTPAMYPLDLAGAGPGHYEEMCDRIVAEFGQLDGILHAGASFAGLAPLEVTEPDAFLQQLHANLAAPWLLTQACLPALRARPDAAVVFVLDDPARSARAYWGAYGIAKAGLRSLLAIAHAETERSSVRLAGLEPGPMRTSIRARAYIEEAATGVTPPAAYAPACVHLLSAAGAAQRGTVWAPRPDPSVAIAPPAPPPAPAFPRILT